jgi:DNA-binding NarL/FixJ family response regulator
MTRRCRSSRVSLGFPLTALLAIALAGGLATPTLAASSNKNAAETSLKRIQRMVARIDEEAKTPEGEEAVVKRLSAQLALSEESLRAKHDTWGLGYGEIAMAYGFASASRTGKTPDDVVAMRSSGTSWTDIAKELGIKVDTVAKRMRRHMRPPSPR